MKGNVIIRSIMLGLVVFAVLLGLGTALQPGDARSRLIRAALVSGAGIAFAAFWWLLLRCRAGANARESGDARSPTVAPEDGENR